MEASEEKFLYLYRVKAHLEFKVGIVGHFKKQ